MAELYWRKTGDEDPDLSKGAQVLTEQNPLPIALRVKPLDATQYEELTEANGLPVQLVSPVKTKIWVSKQLQIPYGATSGALDANDALGNKITFDISVDGDPLPRVGRILSIRRIDLDDDTLVDTIHLFNDDFTAAASDAAFTIGVADGHKHITSQTFPTGTDLGSVKSASVTDINEDYYSPTRQIVAQESTTGTPNIASALVMPLVQIFILPLE